LGNPGGITQLQEGIEGFIVHLAWIKGLFFFIIREVFDFQKILNLQGVVMALMNGNGGDTMETISRQMARFAVALDFGDLPEDVVYEAKRFVLDSIGCALGGSQLEDCQIMWEVLRDLGGEEESTVIAFGGKSSCVQTTLINSLLVRAMDYNDIYWKQDPSHPSDLIPAALAVGEREHRSGKDVLVAIVLAYEFEMRLCEFAIPGIRERKWHHATLTQFVSPIVAGKLLGLTEDQMTHAIGISGCHNLTLGAVTAGKLTMMKNTVDPMATASGVFAALLAQKGYTGPEAIFEGKEGLLDTFGGEWDLSRLTEGLGESFRIKECAMKAYPTEALTHSPITATLELVRTHNLKPERIQKVAIRTIARAVDILADPSKYQPTTKETADHSLPYCIAAAIVDRKVTPQQFEEEKLKDTRIWNLLPKIEVIADPDLEKVFPELKATVVEITTTEGQTYSLRVDYPKGDPRSPMSEEELLEKFYSLADPVIPREKQDRIVETIWKLDQLNDIGEFMTLLG